MQAIERQPQFRLSNPRRGLWELMWSRERPPTPSLVQHMLELSEIPGIRFERDWSMIAIPETALPLAVVQKLVTATETRKALEKSWNRSGLQLQEFLLKRALFPWQEEAAATALANGRGLLLCDVMGLGKTASAAVAAEMAARALDPHRPRLIIGPLFTRDVWRRELLALGLIDDEQEFCALQSRNFNDDSWDPNALWYFVHYDIVHAWSSAILVNKRGKPVVTVIDEAHWVKNSRTQRAKGTQVAASGSQFKMLLSGTPMDNAVAELHHPLTTLCGVNSWGGVTQFRRRYAGALRTAYGMVDGFPSNTDELKERMAPYYLRRTLAEVGDALPPLRREKITAEMDARSAHQHTEIASSFSKGDIQELVNAILENRASTDTFAILDKLRKITASAKLAMTASFVSNLLDQDESVVVFTWQRDTAELIAEACSQKHRGTKRTGWCEPRYIIHGGVQQTTRDNYVAEFQKTGGLLCATYGALREGVTLTKARAIVLHDLDWKMSSILQAEARIHRLGQERGCISTWIVAEDSIDVILARALLKKAELVEHTLGIDAPARAADELDLSRVAGYQDMVSWAREALERMQ